MQSIVLSRQENKLGYSGSNHDFRRDESLSNEYRYRNYVLDDWRNHSLRSPPCSDHWIQTSTGCVLMVIASDIITDLLLNQ